MGVLAAAGIIALTKMTLRLNEDHKNAQYLADRLEEIQSCHVHRNRLDINMVFFTLPNSVIREASLLAGLSIEKIKINGLENGEYRFVTNHGVTKENIDTVVEVMKQIINKQSQNS